MAEAERLKIDPKTVPAWAHAYRAADYPPYAYTADVVGFALDPEAGGLDALLIERGREPFAGMSAWPGGFVEWGRDDTARDAALLELRQETGLARAAYMEELRTYDANGRDPRQYSGRVNGAGEWTPTGVRVVSQAHLALFRRRGLRLAPEPGEDAARAFWDSVYTYLPWEDQRCEAGRSARARIRRQLEHWAESARGSAAAERSVRIEHAFGSGEDWNEERVADRFALLSQALLIDEALRDRWGMLPAGGARPSRAVYGQALAFDHRQMLADALGRLRGKIKYVPALLAAAMPETFTLSELQAAVEAIGGRTLHKQNFRRVVAQSQSFRIVEPTAGTVAGQKGPAARLYRFPADTGLVRLDPSIRMPWTTP